MKFAKHAKKLAFIASSGGRSCMTTRTGANQYAAMSGSSSARAVRPPSAMERQRAMSVARIWEMIHIRGARTKRSHPPLSQSHPDPAGVLRPGRTSRRSELSSAGVTVAFIVSPGSRGPRLLLHPDVNKDRRKDAHDLRGPHAEEVAAPPSADVDAREIEHGALEVDRHRLACAEGRRAPDKVTRVTLGDLRLARKDPLRAGNSRELLRGDLAIAVHEDDERLALVGLHHERLHDVMLRHRERARGHRGSAVLDIFVDVLRVLDALLGEEDRGGRPGALHRSNATRSSRLAPVKTSTAPTTRRICSWES